MFKTSLMETGNGIGRRLLLVVLSALLVIATLVIIPGNAYGDEDSSATTTSEPAVTDTTVSDTTVPDTTIPEASTTTVAAEPAPVTETTTTTSAVVDEEPAPVTETTTTTSTVVEEEPVPVETTTTTSIVVEEEVDAELLAAEEEPVAEPLAAPPSVGQITLEQCGNGSATARITPCDWQKGNINSGKAHMVEGYSVPYRVLIEDIPASAGEMWIEVGYDIRHSSKNALDYLTSYERYEPHFGFGHDPETVDPLSEIAAADLPMPGITFGSIPAPSSAGSPAPGQPTTSFNALPGAEKVITMYGGTISSVTYISQGSLNVAKSETVVRFTFTPNAAGGNVLFAWGGHIAAAADWGEGNAAGGVTGSPYHMRLIDVSDGNVGQQDRQLSAATVFPVGTIIINKIATGGDDNFEYTGVGQLIDGPFSIATASGFGSVTFPDLLADGAGNDGIYTFTELLGADLPAGWTFTDLTCVEDHTDNTTVSGEVATVHLDPNEIVECTYTNVKATSLLLQKTVVTDNGGTAVAADWDLSAGANTVTGSATPVEATDQAGTYALSETTLAGYTNTSLTCDNDAGVEVTSVTIGVGETITCTFVNTDVAPTLKLVKTVDTVDGGDAVANDWTLTAISRGGDASRDISTPGGSGTVDDVFADTVYDLAETGLAGYTPGSWSCVGGTQIGSTIELALGESSVCTINNDDIAPTLKLVKTVTKDDGGDAVANDWTLTAISRGADASRDISTLGGSGTVDDVFANTAYDFAETGPPGYTPGHWSCVITPPDGDPFELVDVSFVELSEGATGVCTINNDDIAPTLKLVKTVDNGDGGNEGPDDWTLTAISQGGDASRDISTPGGSGTVDDVFADTVYDLAESTIPGYAANNWHCVGGTQSGSTIELAPGESSVCTIDNVDIAPTLKLVKTVTKDDGGDAVANDWTLTAISRGADASRDISTLGGSGTVDDVFANTAYDFAETGPPGYTPGHWSCVITPPDGDPFELVDVSFVELSEGETGVCTINNDDVAPTLKLVKTVDNGDGGNAVPNDWTLTAVSQGADDTRDISTLGGSGTADDVFAAVEYALAETTVPGYTNGITWSCTAGTMNAADNGVTLTVGQDAVCSIVNDDVAPTLNLIKQVVSDHGGTAIPADWTLKATSTSTDGDFALPADQVITDELGATGEQDVFANNEYMLSETGTTGHTDDYTQDGPWTCITIDAAGVKGPAVEGDTITLTEGESATCSVVNDDDSAQLTLVKKVVNDNGGTSVAADWTLKATSDSGFGDISALADQHTSMDNLTGDTDVQEVHANNEYTLSEMGTADYTQDPAQWSCVIDGADPVLSNTITLTHGAVATCTATNNDDPAHLILVKDVVNDNGGDAVASAWDLIIDEGAAGEKSVPGSVAGLEVTDQAGTYDLSESTLPGYTNTLITCDNLPDGVPAGAPVTTVTIGIGETVTCTFTNDDDPASLLLQKTVVNDNGGNGVAADWTLSAGSNDVTGSATPVEATDQAGTYALSESVEPGYSMTSLTCDNVEGEVTEVTIGLGETVTCEFVNDDLPAGVDIEKSTNGEDADSPTGPYVPVGDAVNWEYEITNPGQIPLSNVVVTDDMGVTPVYQSGDTNTDSLLDPGETWIYTATGVAVAGQYANIGTVTAVVGGDAVLLGVVDAGIGDTITDTDPSHYFGVESAINIEKSTNGEDADTPTGPEILLGETVTWKYVVTNPGNTPLANIVVTDDQGVTPVYQSGDTNGDDLLDPTETWMYEATGVSELGQYANIGSVTGVDVTGATVTATDPSHYLGFGLASLGDTVWNDANSNGVQDNGEKGIAGALVKLTLPDGTTLNTTTDVDGKYLFTDLIPGTYTVEIVMSSIPQPDEGELKLTTAGSFTVILEVGDNDLDSDFGVVAVLPVTGINTTDIARIAFALLLAGAFAVLLTTRKRRDEGDITA